MLMIYVNNNVIIKMINKTHTHTHTPIFFGIILYK